MTLPSITSKFVGDGNQGVQVGYNSGSIETHFHAPSNTQLRQDGSQFGATHATSGATVFQGNFVGLTFSEPTLMLLTYL